LTIACVFPIAPLRLPTLRKCELLLAHATVRDHQRDPVGRHLLLSGLRSPGGGTDCPTGVASQKHRLCMSRLDIQGVARSDGVVWFAGVVWFEVMQGTTRPRHCRGLPSFTGGQSHRIPLLVEEGWHEATAWCGRWGGVVR